MANPPDDKRCQGPVRATGEVWKIGAPLRCPNDAAIIVRDKISPEWTAERLQLCAGCYLELRKQTTETKKQNFCAENSCR